MKILMWERTPDQWRKILGRVIIFVLLLIVLQPELRATLLIVDLIGFDLFLLLCLAQVRSYGPTVGLVAFAVIGYSGALILRLASAANWAAHIVFPGEGLWIASSAVVAVGFAIALHIAGMTRTVTTAIASR